MFIVFALSKYICQFDNGYLNIKALLYILIQHFKFICTVFLSEYTVGVFFLKQE